MDQFAIMKVTCSSARVGEKLDLFGETHDQAVLQEAVPEVYQVATEKEAQVVNLAESELMLHTFALKFEPGIKMRVPQRN